MTWRARWRFWRRRRRQPGTVTVTFTFDTRPLTAALEQTGAAIRRMHAALAEALTRRELVITDPATTWARSWREFGRQLRDIVVHEVMVAGGQPERSPGARIVRTPRYRLRTFTSGTFAEALRRLQV